MLAEFIADVHAGLGDANSDTLDDAAITAAMTHIHVVAEADAEVTSRHRTSMPHTHSPQCVSVPNFGSWISAHHMITRLNGHSSQIWLSAQIRLSAEHSSQIRQVDELFEPLRSAVALLRRYGILLSDAMIEQLDRLP